MTLQTRVQAGLMRLVTAINALKSYTDSEILDAITTAQARAGHTGTQSADTIVDGTTNHVFTAADDTKLAGIADNATAYDDADADARVDAKVGVLSTLTTTAKTTAVAAINELDAAIDAVAAGSGAIDDGTTSTSTTWSSTKTANEIAAAIAALVDGAPALLDTLNEIAEALGDNPDVISDILTALNNRVRFDAAQTLTSGEKIQATDNIGAATVATVGDTDYDFVADIEAALV